MATEKRLIDANALIEQFDESIFKGFVMKRLIEMQPTVDAVEVVHGRWEVHEHPYIKPRQDGWICTNCSFVTEDIANGDTNYCPNCGAKMDGDGNG